MGGRVAARQRARRCGSRRGECRSRRGRAARSLPRRCSPSRRRPGAGSHAPPGGVALAVVVEAQGPVPARRDAVGDVAVGAVRRAVPRNRTRCRRPRRGATGASGWCSMPKQRASSAPNHSPSGLRIAALRSPTRSDRRAIPIAASHRRSIGPRSGVEVEHTIGPHQTRRVGTCVVFAVRRELVSTRRRARRSARPRSASHAHSEPRELGGAPELAQRRERVLVKRLEPSARSQSTSCSRRLANRCTGLVVGRRARCACTSASAASSSSRVVEAADAVELHELDVRQAARVDRRPRPKMPGVVVAVELVVARVVEVAEPPIRSRSIMFGTIVVLTCSMLVRDPGGVGEVEGVDLGGEQPAHLELLLDVVLEPAPRVHLGDVEAVERSQVLERELEELPLVALEVDRERERQAPASQSRPSACSSSIQRST